MGAIVSTKKQPKKSRVEHKALAVNAFIPRQQENGGIKENPPITDPNENNTNIAVSSWGEGVVGTSTHNLQDTGVVSSRGVDYDVITSKQLYPNINKDSNHSYAIVTSLEPNDAALIIQRHVRGHQTRKELEEQRNAALKIQKYIRGHQARKDLEQQQKAAQVIQKKYRQHLGNTDRRQGGTNSQDDDDEESDEETDQQKVDYRKAWNESTPKARVLDKNMKIGDKTKESFDMYQDDITNLKWKTEQQLELTTMGDDYVPPRVLDFSNTTLELLLERISEELDCHKTNSKARSIGFICKGGPGYFNPVKGVMVTKKKTKQEEELSSFWKTIGTKMSKLKIEDTKIHIIGCNVTGNKQGEKLLKFLSKFVRPSLVRFESPLEMSEAGREMLSLYFDYSRYRTWKTRMYSKVTFDL